VLFSLTCFAFAEIKYPGKPKSFALCPASNLPLLRFLKKNQYICIMGLRLHHIVLFMAVLCGCLFSGPATAGAKIASARHSTGLSHVAPKCGDTLFADLSDIDVVTADHTGQSVLRQVALLNAINNLPGTVIRSTGVSVSFPKNPLVPSFYEQFLLPFHAFW
jgi:hypothetical protein